MSDLNDDDHNELINLVRENIKVLSHINEVNVAQNMHQKVISLMIRYAMKVDLKIRLQLLTKSLKINKHDRNARIRD